MTACALSQKYLLFVSKPDSSEQSVQMQRSKIDAEMFFSCFNVWPLRSVFFFSYLIMNMNSDLIHSDNVLLFLLHHLNIKYIWGVKFKFLMHFFLIVLYSKCVYSLNKQCLFFLLLSDFMSFWISNIFLPTYLLFLTSVYTWNNKHCKRTITW